jgi:putative SOS response-associated peptidase YedK
MAILALTVKPLAAWKDPQGHWLCSCTIITTRPNELVAEVHDRMPVILPLNTEADWLDPDLSVDHALSLREPFPADELRSVAVSRLVNSMKNEGPQLARTRVSHAAQAVGTSLPATCPFP